MVSLLEVSIATVPPPPSRLLPIPAAPSPYHRAPGLCPLCPCRLLYFDRIPALNVRSGRKTQASGRCYRKGTSKMPTAGQQREAVFIKPIWTSSVVYLGTL
uniref:Uncharacterized protein n=1 Tax=Oryza barthii TaxID=65489 RepID=A0A0D3G6P5_9ORYZ